MMRRRRRLLQATEAKAAERKNREKEEEEARAAAAEKAGVAARQAGAKTEAEVCPLPRAGASAAPACRIRFGWCQRDAIESS